MLSLKLASFRSFLKHKVLMTGCELAIVEEPYTTMTCGACGHLNSKLGGISVQMYSHRLLA